MRKLSLLKPDIRRGILKNEQADKFVYLSVPENIGIADLKRDIELGAVQYKDVGKIVEKDEVSKYVVITPQTMEMGYMAISYMAACYNEKKENSHSMDFRNDEVTGIDEWLENSYQIPIIEEREINMITNNVNNPLPFGDIFAQGNCFSKPNRPYWLDCNTMQVCVIVKNYGMVCGDNNVLINGLDVFKNNERVYILIEPDEYCNDSEWFENNSENEGEGEWYDDGSMDKIKYIVLNYAADDIEVKLEKENVKKYYGQVLKGFFYDNNISVKRGFSYQKIVDIIVAMNDKNKCELTEKIVKYAIKDMKSDTHKELTIRNFDFIDRFVKSRIEKNNNGKSSAEKIKNELIGMDNVKEQIFDIVNLMKYNKLRVEMKIGHSTYHNVHAMLGAPGTAKTTMAKLMGQMMMEQGLLRDNRFVCVNGAELKGKYVGHSAPKTKALFESYDIIVIDEAYSLVDNHGDVDSFSNEAIAQLVIELEEHSMDKLVIFTGYGGKNISARNNKMQNFFDANPGIKSRITSIIYFDSYTPDEMVKIFYSMAKTQKFIVENSAREIIYSHFCKRVSDDNFGNGREARSLLETSILFAAKRIFNQGKTRYTKNQMQTITYNDIAGAIKRIEKSQMEAPDKTKRTIGFMA